MPEQEHSGLCMRLRRRRTSLVGGGGGAGGEALRRQQQRGLVLIASLALQPNYISRSRETGRKRGRNRRIKTAACEG